jgi:L-lactate dehydrogenase complex protein LldG
MTGTREKILQSIADAISDGPSLPVIEQTNTGMGDTVQKFIAMVAAVGGKVVDVGELTKLKEDVYSSYHAVKIISTIPQLPWYSENISDDPHSFEDVELAILKGHLGVAENGAVWLTDVMMGDRAIPFIVQHLALVVAKNSIVPTLYEAYEKIGSLQYDFGVFIAGPSKTADIEQSLVFGAHGPKSLTVYLIG